ncbi:MAG: PAS domain S-box protein, partial [Verrucomicrobia bacterium]|nr:PAS domain S-box protein [Verrucomicrobiota bacterium]
MRVLIADDSQPIRERLVTRLSQISGVEIAEAVDTPEALRQTEVFKPNVAVLDIRMPGGGGIKALGEIKRMKPDTTVIIITNYPYAQYRRKCLDEGADFFFDKSTEFEQVAETIRQLMNPGTVNEVARRTAASQLVAAKEELERTTQRQMDLGLLNLLNTRRGPAEEETQAYAMWEKTFDAMPDLVAVFDADHSIVRVNKAMADGLGFPAVELIGKKCYEYMHGTVCPAAGCPHEAMLQDWQQHVHEMYSETLNGWFRVSVSPIYLDERIIGAIHIARNITRQKKMEEYSDMSREILEVLNSPNSEQNPIHHVLEVLKKRTGFDAVGIRLQNGDDFPYFVQDGFPTDFLLKENTLVERGADGGVCRNEDGSPRLECTCGLVLSGKTDPSIPFFTKGGSFWENDTFPLLDLPASQDPRLHPRNNCIHLGYASVALVPIRSMNRIVGLIQLNDRRRGCFSLETIEQMEEIAAHIGEALLRKQAEAQLKESEIRYRGLFASMHAGFALHEIICDENGIPCDYRFLEVNPAFEKLTGLKSEELIGRTVKEVMPKIEAHWIEGYGKVALTGVPMQVDDFSGELGRHYAVSAYSPCKGRFATVFTDITEEKNAEVAVLRTALDVAEEANRIKTQFLANMSHELRTPLNAIIGLAELLESSTLNEEQLDYIQTISSSGESLLMLISDLLDFSKIELGKIQLRPEAFSVRTVVDKT